MHCRNAVVPSKKADIYAKVRLVRKIVFSAVVFRSNKSVNLL
jgi:hypothetical protein